MNDRTEARLALFTSELLREQEAQRRAGIRIRMWLEAIKSLRLESAAAAIGGDKT